MGWSPLFESTVAPDGRRRYRLGHELVDEFFKAVATTARMNLHITVPYGTNNHHIAESCFKGLARALRTALLIDPAAATEIPSTKGSLGA